MAYTDIEKRNAWFRDRYRRNQEYVRNYKVNTGCADCGWNKHHAGLEFDHLDGRLRGTVASMMGRSLKVIMEEIEQCEVVCGTCHNIRTWERSQTLQSV